MGKGQHAPEHQAIRGDEETAPRYAKICQILRDRIGDGTYALGAPIPTEAELCTEFGASRFTVREALRRLVESGMVERRKGSGSFVRASTPPSTFVQSMRSLSELFQYAVETSLDVLTTRLVRIDSRIAEALEAAPRSRWLRVLGVRRVPETGEPICYTAIYVDRKFAPLLDDVGTLRTPIYAAIEERSGETILEARQEIRAERMRPGVAAALAHKRGSWALVVTRRYLGREGQTMLCSMSWHPADRFRYTMRIKREEF
jgi:DNA-binding GntR family transcriptional regulator